MTSNEEEYLTEQELKDLEEFLEERKISKSEVARRFGKRGQTGVYWFAVKRFSRLRARKFIEEEKERTLKAFEKVKKF